MNPRDALIAAVRAGVLEGMISGVAELSNWTDDECLSLVPEEARTLLLGQKLVADVESFHEGQREGMAEALRIARERARWHANTSGSMDGKVVAADIIVEIVNRLREVP